MSIWAVGSGQRCSCSRAATNEQRCNIAGCRRSHTCWWDCAEAHITCLQPLGAVRPSHMIALCRAVCCLHLGFLDLSPESSSGWLAFLVLRARSRAAPGTHARLFLPCTVGPPQPPAAAFESGRGGVVACPHDCCCSSRRWPRLPDRPRRAGVPVCCRHFSFVPGHLCPFLFPAACEGFGSIYTHTVFSCVDSMCQRTHTERLPTGARARRRLAVCV